MLSLMIDFVRPCVHGLFLFMTIYYYPPPMYFLLEMLYKTFNIQAIYISLQLLYIAFLKKPRMKRVVPLYPSNGLRIFPDCSIILPVRLLIFTALMLRMEYIYLFEGAFCHLLLNHPYSVFNAILFGLAIFLEYIKARIRFGTSTYYYDGVRIYMQIPWLVRTLFPSMTYKALISNFAYGAVQRLQATLFRIWRVCDLV